jgi:hypothetical protein
MRSTRFALFVLLLAALVGVPASARAMAVQANPVGGQPLDPEYADRVEEENRDEARRRQDLMHTSAACDLGCSEHEGIQTRPISGTSLVGVVHQASVDDGILTVRLRFYNDGAETARLTIDPTAGYEGFFVQVGGEKLLIVKDEEGELEAKEPLEVDLKPGKVESWWAKFPAPPAGTEAFDLEIPPVATFRDVPLEDD